MLIVGVQTEYKLAASSVDPMASITGVAPGQTVQIIAQAVNGNLQGVASDALTFTVPVAKAALKSAAVLEAPAQKERATGNENGNGHALHSRGA